MFVISIGFLLVANCREVEDEHNDCCRTKISLLFTGVYINSHRIALRPSDRDTHIGYQRSRFFQLSEMSILPQESDWSLGSPSVQTLTSDRKLAKTDDWSTEADEERYRQKLESLSESFVHLDAIPRPGVFSDVVCSVLFWLL